MRRYAKQTNIRLWIGFFLLLFVVGDGLIYLIYGKGAAIVGLMCLGALLIPILLVWLILLGLEWVAKRGE